MQEITKHYEIKDDCEISIESNPGTLNIKKLEAYVNAGINRLSIGLQAVQDKHLKTLGRIHDYRTFEETYSMARTAGFKNINIDLIFGIPGQSGDEWNETLEKVVGLGPEHLSCYSLKIEAGTMFDKIYNKNSEKYANSYPRLPSEEQEREMYHSAIRHLKKNNYKHYEISNFCKEGFECNNNLTYWKCDKYLGFGAGAHSFEYGKRFRNYLKVEKYIESLDNNRLPRTDFKKINTKESTFEYIMLGLRMIEGIDIKEFKEKFNLEFEAVYKIQIAKLIKNDLIVKRGCNYCLTEKGLDVANQVMIEF